MAAWQRSVDADGRGRRAPLKLTNLDKVLYPETGTTKAEVIDYYARVADVLLPHAAPAAGDPQALAGRGRRPTTTRAGVLREEPRRRARRTGCERRTIQHSDHDNDYPLVNDLATLVWLAQIAALEMHVPQWRFGRERRSRKNPDRLVLDLDPGAGVGLAECAEVARLGARHPAPTWGSTRCR